MKSIIIKLKQRLLPTLLVVLATLLPTTAAAYDFMVDGLCYDKNSDTSVSVTFQNFEPPSYTSLNGRLIIPESVTFEGKTYSVTDIGTSAFDSCTGLTSVTIPNSVDVISSYAFCYCSGLTSVSIGNSVEAIGDYAFYLCSSLKSVIIPNSVTRILSNAFTGCRNMTSITIGNSVTQIVPAQFDGCSSLSSIQIAADNPKYDSRDNCNAIIETASNTLVLGCKSTVIPNSVSEIGTWAFINCSGLTSVTIPNSVTSIGNNAFYNCSGLTSVTWNAESCKDFSSEYIPFKKSTNIKTFEFGNEVKKIPAYLCCNLNSLTSVTIPNSVAKVGSYAFSGCSGLTEIISLPIVPPSLGSDCFQGVDKSIPVYVSNIGAYSSASGWKEFTNFQSLGVGSKKLTVELPDDFNDGRYKDCYIEVDNADGSTHHRCLVTDKQSYTFKVPEYATYNAMVKNALGVVLGEMTDVTLDGDETTVTFDSLKRPHEVSLAVTLPDGEDVTDRVTITWTLGDDFIGQGPDLQGPVEGMKLTYELKLPSDLATTYVQPQPTEYTVNSGGNSILVKLQPFGTATLTGVVVDDAGGTPLARATVTLSQTLNGHKSRSIAVQTDGKGNFELEAFAAPGQLTVSASGYISTTVDVASAEGATAIGTLRLSPITGVTVNMLFTHRGSVRSGESADTENYYADYANVAYTVRNKTQNREITQLSVQYPEIVLLEDVDEGDELEVTARSLTGAFADVTASCSVADNRAAVTLPIVDYGGVTITVNEMDATSAVGMLYDSNGELSRRGTFSGGSLQFNNLPDGDYTLVAMQQSDYLNKVLTVDGLTAAGLRSGTDFVRQNVTVRSGVISEVNLARIPALDESIVQYTGSNTYFNPNATSVTIGALVVLTARVDFKNVYRDKTKNVSLLFDLPQGCEFVEQSVMVDNKVALYTRDGQRVIVSVPEAGGQVKFCAIPTLSGEVRPSAAVQLSIDGSSVTQPIGTAEFEAKALDIKVPALTVTPDIAISGTAPAGSEINIYDNGELIGATTTTAGGTWNARCTLVNAYNLSSHQVNAKAITRNGVELLSQSTECVIDRDALKVSKVTMYHDNPEQGETYKIIFDYLNPITTAQPWTYYIYNKKFTFTIEFTDNNPSIISDVVLYVKTANSGWHPLEATFDERQELWVASGSFGNMYDGDLPEDVSVDYTVETKPLFDKKQMTDAKQEYEAIADGYLSSKQLLNELFNQYDDALSDQQFREICEKLGIEYTDFDDGDVSEFDGWTEDKINAYLDSCYTTGVELLDSLDHENETCDKWFDLPNQYSETVADGSTFSYGNCDGLTPGDLITQGYEALETTDGSLLYLLTTETDLCMVDFENNLRIAIHRPSSSYDVRQRAPLPEIYSDTWGKIAEARELVENIYVEYKEKLALPVDKLTERKELLEKELRRCKGNLKKCKFGSERFQHWSRMIKSAEKSYATTLTLLKYSKTLIRFLAKALPIVDYIATLNNCYAVTEQIAEIYTTIPEPCKGDQANAIMCMTEAQTIWETVATLAMVDVVTEVMGDVTILSSIALAAPTAGTSLTATGWGLGQKILAQAGKIAISYLAQEVAMKHLRTKVNNLACVKNNPNLKNLSTEPAGDKYPGSVLPRVLIDPSGYVYEAVPSNRLQGVTATIYYKETVEDMWGQPSEQEVMWDAEEYAQRNPLFTDENGMYQWDVPQGLWQVRFAKQGYEPARSEWLPVPPPQLDVNIGMTQLRQPEVAMVHAYSDGVELSFDKYMRPSTLTNENIRLTYKGKAVESDIELLDAEQGDSETYARKVRLIPATEFADGEVALTVLPAVESYAGVTMNSTFEQSFGIEPRIRVIAVDSVLNVGYGESREVKVRVLPLDIAAGKTLLVNSNQPMIASIEDGAAVTLDDHGMATLTVAGNLPGATTMTLNVDGFDLLQQARINVVDESSLLTSTPVASAWNGKVFGSSLTLELSCETEGAEIWYTLDGSCPCDLETRMRYTGPITIDCTTTLKAIAQAPGHYESDIATYYYFLVSSVSDVQDGTPFTLRVQDGALVVNGLKSGPCEVSVYTLSGAEVVRRNGVLNGERIDLSHLTQGVYVAVVITEGRPMAVRFVL